MCWNFWSVYSSSSKSILDVLETIYLQFRKPIVQRVTVVKFGVYNGGGNCKIVKLFAVRELVSSQLD